MDYTRCSDTTGSASIDPVFDVAKITDLAGNADYSWYWMSTTHLDGLPVGAAAVYIAFGEALGSMNGIVMDVHGAGSQRSDPKTGERSDYPAVHEQVPQGDVQTVYNFARAVRFAD